MPEILIILFICALTLIPLAVVVWLGIRLVGTRTKQNELEARIEALERGARQR